MTKPHIKLILCNTLPEASHRSVVQTASAQQAMSFFRAPISTRRITTPWSRPPHGWWHRHSRWTTPGTGSRHRGGDWETTHGLHTTGAVVWVVMVVLGRVAFTTRRSESDWCVRCRPVPGRAGKGRPRRRRDAKRSRTGENKTTLRSRGFSIFLFFRRKGGGSSGFFLCKCNRIVVM